MTSASARPPRQAGFLASGALLLALASGCGGPAAPPAAAETQVFPVWDAGASELFDDNIDPAAVGLLMEGKPSRSDPALRDRARTADLVARVNVSTVTAETVIDRVTYRLVIQVLPPPFNTPTMTDTTFELSVPPGARAYGIMKALDMRLRGASFIGFLRRFAAEGGESAVHWHLAPDNADVAAAVKDALALAELSGS